MKKILIIFLLYTGVHANAQKLETNRPDLVFPILEEFIADSYYHNTPVLEKLQFLDSIVIRELPLIVVDGKIQQARGYHHRNGKRSWIEIDAGLINSPFEFNRALKHELGHFFSLKDIPTHQLTMEDPLRLEIMSSYHAHYYLEWKFEEDPKLWKRINEHFYKSLQTTTQ